MKVASRLHPRALLWSFLFTGCTGILGEVDGFDAGGGPDPVGNGGSFGSSSGGSSGTGTGGRGTGGTGGGGGSVTLPSSGLPCDVQGLVQGRCQGCHAATPLNGAPMPLVTRANLTALSAAYPGQTFAQRALARVQLTAGQMPPAPAARASAAEIQGLNNWIGAGYPATTCATAGGVGGASGVGGRTGTGTGGAGGVSTTGSVPCDVQSVYQSKCTTCHAAMPVNGAPMPLVTRANLMAKSIVDAAQTFAQRTVVRMQSTTNPMPPAPGTRATTAEITTVNNWILAGYPAGTTTCGTGGGGGTADPLNATARCTSGTMWTGGNNGSSSMNPGRDCIGCHAGEEDAPRFTIAGTLYPTGHEPNLCNGVNGSTGARVVIVDAANRTITLTPNAAGNFTSSTGITPPYRAKVTYQGRERIMPVAQTNGACNSCHTQNGTNGAPGRITLP
ncbi:MAG TPA: hypothetical protein VFH68_04100 [Polyangia bacterium]|jgi:mono/diheme cytochrome c family protein|nr:hypothetical protein [Polyangia bacterium]